MNIFKKITVIISASLLTFSASAEVVSKSSMVNLVIKAVPVVEQQSVSGQYPVSSNGFVSLPHLDQAIKASGLSGAQLSRKIEKAYVDAGIYTKPLISITTAKDVANEQIDRAQVTVGGRVKRAGPVPYVRGMTIFTAVTAAGGEDTFGNLRKVRLLRGGKAYTYDLKNPEHMQEKVYPNDVITVPEKGLFSR